MNELLTLAVSELKSTAPPIARHGAGGRQLLSSPLALASSQRSSRSWRRAAGAAVVVDGGTMAQHA